MSELYSQRGKINELLRTNKATLILKAHTATTDKVPRIIEVEHLGPRIIRGRTFAYAPKRVYFLWGQIVEGSERYEEKENDY